MEENENVPVEQTTTPEVNATEQVNKPEQREKKYVPLEELIKERQKRRAMEDRLEVLEKNMSSNRPSDVQDIAKELGVDEDAAKKLHAVLSKYSGKRDSSGSELEGLSAKFQERVVEASSQFEDWDSIKDEMMVIFNEKYAQDPKRAFSQDPESYYYQAVAKRSQKEKEDRKLKQDKNEKIESQSLATVESGSRSGSTAPRKNVWSRDRIRSLSSDDYRKHLPEIQSAIAKGEVN